MRRCIMWAVCVVAVLWAGPVHAEEEQRSAGAAAVVVEAHAVDVAALIVDGG
jgi:hypothetical protein